MGIPVVGLIDTNTNPKNIDLVIPANDDGRGSIELIVGQLVEAYTKGKESRSGAKPSATKTAKKIEKKG